MSRGEEWSPQHLAPLVELLYSVLRQHPDGVREHTLIQAVRDAALPGFPNGPLSDPLTLFRSHFLVRHALYHLRERCLEATSHWLEMDALTIRLQPYRPGLSALATHDPLRAYYLDIEQLQQTRPDEVERLLASFWLRLAGSERRQAALELFGLDDPVDRETVRRQYRRLAMQHHPDRGGDASRFQALRQAYEILCSTTPLAKGSDR
ncbi:MAG: DNA-J related domain-containing protein [Gammaproteobacteria bacterium]